MLREIRDYKEKYLFSSITENISFFGELFYNDALYRVRSFNLPDKENTEVSLLFFDGMVNSQFINDSVIRPLLTHNYKKSENIADYIEKNVLFANEVKLEKDISLILSDILYGDSLLLIDNSDYGILIDTKGWRTRGISEPDDERVLQGPREGFDEAVMPNLSMLKRKLITPDLAIENITLGRKTDTKIFICYLDSVVKHSIVNKIKENIRNIDIDGILDSNYINELINNNKFSFFKTVGTTERPDVVAAKLLEGRVAVFVDGTPVVLTIPYIFAENFQSDDDYYQHFTVAALGRVLRYACFYIATSVPALFAALTVFNPQFLPITFFTTIASSRSGVPFSTFFESLILILVFELLKETGVRMQQSVGHALSIVGGLVVGQAAVEAKLISAPVLIITALSGIAGLMLPKMRSAIFYYKIIMLIFSSVFGLFGFFIGFTVMHINLYSLKSFDTDYVQLKENIKLSNLKDGLIRFPWRTMHKRPTFLTDNIIRMKRKK